MLHRTTWVPFAFFTVALTVSATLAERALYLKNLRLRVGASGGTALQQVDQMRKELWSGGGEVP